jgi:methylated-DNA-protein-cysteine methyltransferase-like protein
MITTGNMKEPSYFTKKVWECALSIPFGKVTTYGDIARAAGGGAQASRSITNILSGYPEREKIPFHRIVYAGGKVWLSKEDEKRRRALYKKEGIIVDEKGVIKNFHEIHYVSK